jgi:hypothetical protein
LKGEPVFFCGMAQGLFNAGEENGAVEKKDG